MIRRTAQPPYLGAGLDLVMAGDLLRKMAAHLTAGETVMGLAKTNRLPPLLSHVAVTSSRIVAFHTDVAEAGFEQAIWSWDIATVDVRHSLSGNAYLMVIRINGEELDFGDMHSADASTIRQLALRLTGSAPAVQLPEIGDPPGPGWRYMSPPGWPVPPPGWVPPKGWRPDPSWPAAPPGWQFWVPEAPAAPPSPPEARRTRRRGLFGNRKLVEQLEAENARLRDWVTRLRGMDVIQLAAEQERLRDEVHETTARLARLRAQVEHGPPFTGSWGMAQLPEDVRSSLRFFAFYLANGTVDVELLAGVDYRPALMEYGSALEMAFTIFTNVLEVDETGKVTNHAVAQRRAAQWIRSYCDPAYEIDPPLQEWETELAGP